MRTSILTFILILGFSAGNYARPINDIFSIQENPPYEEEAYVNDIPFDTEKIFAAYQLDKVIRKYRDEKNISDCAFNTMDVASHSLLIKMTEEYKDELEINDIPRHLPSTWIIRSDREMREILERIRIRMIDPHSIFIIESNLFARFHL